MNSMTQSLINMLISEFEVNPTDLRPDVTFDELGVDSLVLIEMAVAIERDSGIAVGDGLLTSEQTIEQSAAVLESAGVRL